jgi:hypothetical protein
MLRTWRKRWIVLCDTFIAYYKNRESTVPLGYLQIDSGLNVITQDRIVRIITKSRLLLLSAQSAREATQWKEDILAFYFTSMRRLKHPFDSSFTQRSGSDIRLYICGKDYFSALAIALLEAKEEILLASWMVSPTLLLTRPPDMPIRLDQLLKLKANEGVKIYIMLYKEVLVSRLYTHLHLTDIKRYTVD